MCVYIDILSCPSLLTTVLAAWSISTASHGSYLCCLHSPFLLHPTSAVQISSFPKVSSSSSCFTNCSINAASSPLCCSSQRDSGFSCPPGSSHCLSTLSHSQRNPLP